MVHCVILVRPKQDGSFLWSHDLSRDFQKVDTKWTRFRTGLDGLAFAFRLPTSFYWIRYIICLVYILTHRWGSVLMFNAIVLQFVMRCLYHQSLKNLCGLFTVVAPTDLYYAPPSAVQAVLLLAIISLHLQGLYSLSDKTSYRKTSWNLEAARFGFRLLQLLWHLTGA